MLTRHNVNTELFFNKTILKYTFEPDSHGGALGWGVDRKEINICSLHRTLRDTLTKSSADSKEDTLLENFARSTCYESGRSSYLRNFLDGNWHRDTGRHEPKTAWFPVFLALSLSVDLIEGVLLAAKIRRLSRSQDGPFRDRVQLYPYKWDTWRNPRIKSNY